MTEICFFVDGIARAKQSFRATRHGHGYTPARVKVWQAEVGWAGQQAMRTLGLVELLEGNLEMDVIFFLKDARRIDSDNLSKAAQDALNGIVYKDDCRNIDLHIHKYICRGLYGCLIQIKPAARPLEISVEQAQDIIYAALPLKFVGETTTLIYPSEVTA